MPATTNTTIATWVQNQKRIQTFASARERAVTVVTGRPRPAALLGRSSFSHFETRVGNVEMIISSKP